MEIDDDFDVDRVKAGIIILVAVIVLVVGIIWAVNYESLSPYRAQCEKNPIIRYAEKCDSYKECVTICAERLRKNDG